MADLVLVLRSDKAVERLCDGSSALGLVGGKAGVAIGGHGLQGSADLVRGGGGGGGGGHHCCF